MSVLLHIGLFKTGTTSLQRFLRDREECLLAPRGIRYPVGWLRRDCHLEPHMALMRPDRTSSAREHGDEWRDPAWREMVLDQVRADLARHPDELTILSCEHTSLLRYDDELAGLRDLAGDAQVVVYFRDRDAWLASMTDQLLKNGIPLSADPDSHAYMAPDSWRVNYQGLLELWRRHFTNVKPVDYDAVCAWDGSVIPSFTRLLGIPDVELPRLDSYWLNTRGGIDPRVPGSRWTSPAGAFGDPAAEAPRGPADLPREAPAEAPRGRNLQITL